MPFHAFLTTFFNTVFFDAAATPPLTLKLWKEGILLLITLIFGYTLIRDYQNFKWDKLDIALLCFLVLGFILIPFTYRNIYELLLGIKYEFLFLGLFFILKHFQFSADQKQQILKTVLWSASLVIGLGLFSYLFLPENFLTWFGYSNLASTFHPNSPLPYCHKISGTDQCRLQATFSGANQLGSYLLVILPLILASSIQIITRKTSWLLKLTAFFYKQNPEKNFLQSIHRHKLLIMVFALGILALFLTFSRSAWIGFGLGLILFFYFISQNKRHFKQFLLLIGIGALVIPGIAYFSNNDFIKNYLVRAASSSLHWEKNTEGIELMIQYPFGLGLGRAGPASGYMTENYTGLIPENWYLQIGLELGFAGMALFITILILILRHFKKIFQKNPEKNRIPLALAAGLFGLSVSCLFLPSLEDAPTVLTCFTLLGVWYNE